MSLSKLTSSPPHPGPGRSRRLGSHRLHHQGRRHLLVRKRRPERVHGIGGRPDGPGLRSDPGRRAGKVSASGLTITGELVVEPFATGRPAAASSAMPPTRASRAMNATARTRSSSSTPPARPCIRSTRPGVRQDPAQAPRDQDQGRQGSGHPFRHHRGHQDRCGSEERGMERHHDRHYNGQDSRAAPSPR